VQGFAALLASSGQENRQLLSNIEDEQERKQAAVGHQTVVLKLERGCEKVTWTKLIFKIGIMLPLFLH
jgi:hypothetical protein